MLAMIVRTLFAASISILISIRGYQKNSLNFSGATLAVFVGFFCTIANFGFFACLMTFFATSSILTKWKSERKRRLEENFKEGGQRNAMQVLCNGGLAVVISIVYIVEVGFVERPIDFSKDFTASVLITALVGFFACCNADTWSSEIGTAIGSDAPILITTFKRVPAGTNGAISLAGTLGSVAGGLVIGLAYAAAVQIALYSKKIEIEYPPQWPLLLLATISGFLGSILDSYLGAILQYSGFCTLRKKIVSRPHHNTTKHVTGSNILDNDQVNFLASLVMALMTPVIGYRLWWYLAS